MRLLRKELSQLASFRKKLPPLITDRTSLFATPSFYDHALPLSEPLLKFKCQLSSHHSFTLPFIS